MIEVSAEDLNKLILALSGFSTELSEKIDETNKAIADLRATTLSIRLDIYTKIADLDQRVQTLNAALADVALVAKKLLPKGK